MDPYIRQVRSFNRIVGQRIGALEERFLGRARPMSESRLLYEIGREGAEARSLRTALDLDSGYVSRLLRSLERQGLVESADPGADKRVRRFRLTAAGLDELDEIDRRSDTLAGGMLAPLNEPQRSRLVAAMAEVEKLLLASAIEIAPARPTTAAARFCLSSYFEEIDRRFEGGFDPGRTLVPDAGVLVPPNGLLLVATLRGRPVGCGALRRIDQATADVKRMWTDPSVRGWGLGRRLIATLEAEARKMGVERLRLDTNRALKEAQSLYRSCGFEEVAPFNDEPYAHHWFEKSLLSPGGVSG